MFRLAVLWLIAAWCRGLAVCLLKLGFDHDLPPLAVCVVTLYLVQLGGQRSLLPVKQRIASSVAMVVQGCRRWTLLEAALTSVLHSRLPLRLGRQMYRHGLVAKRSQGSLWDSLGLFADDL